MANKTELGTWGEAIAAEALRSRGFTVVEQNYRSRYGEIDIIAENREYLVFAEVKLRKSAYFGAAREFVDAESRKSCARRRPCGSRSMRRAYSRGLM